MAEDELRRRFRQQLNRYQQIEQWLGDRLRRRAKADDWLRNRLIRGIVVEDEEARRLEERLRTANPPANRVEYFRGTFDGIPSGASGPDFDFALESAVTRVATCAFLQERGFRPIRRLPERPQTGDFIAGHPDGQKTIAACVSLRGYARELHHLYDAVAAELIGAPAPGGGLTVYGTREYLIDRLEDRIRWTDQGVSIVRSMDGTALSGAIVGALSDGHASLAGGLFGIVATSEPGLRLSLLSADERVPAAEHPLFLAARLEIATNIGWMHNHALDNDFASGYLLVLDATGPAYGPLDQEELDSLLRDYMALMWETNPAVSLEVWTNAAVLAYPAPGVPTARP